MSRTKYVLIERTDSSKPIAMTPAVLADIDNTPFYGTVTGSKPVTLTEIRKQGIRIYTDEEHAGYQRQCAEHDAWDRFRAANHKKPQQATVDWFDNVRGEGMVTIPDVGRFCLYACNIKGRKTWYPETACVYYSKGQIVEVELDCESYRNVFCMGLTQGTPDVEGWDRIKGRNLAFRCDEEGTAITGLFD